MFRQAEKFFPSAVNSPLDFHRALVSVIYWSSVGLRHRHRTGPRGNPWAAGAEEARETANRFKATIEALIAAAPLMLPTFRKGRQISKSAFDSAVITKEDGGKFASHHDVGLELLRDLLRGASDDDPWPFAMSDCYKKFDEFYHGFLPDLEAEAAALDAVGSVATAPPQSSRISVRTNPPQIVVDGIVQDLSPDEASCMNELVKAKGDWVSGSTISDKTGVARPDKLLKSVAKKLHAGTVVPVIEAQRGKGSRITEVWRE